MSVLEQLLGAAMQGMNRGGTGGSIGATPAGDSGASPIMGILLQLLTSGAQGGASGQGAQGGGLGGLLGGLLGGGAAPGRPGAGGDPLSQLAGALLGGGQGGGQGGGLSGLLQQFQQAGLGRQADSWVGTGQNLPVSPDELTQVFGRDRLQGLADRNGLDLNQLLGGLSQQLPTAVDALTPKGAVPQPDDLAATIGSLLGGRR